MQSQPKEDPRSSEHSDDTGSDQAIQINDNTIADPEQPEADPGDAHLHSRTDFDKVDQGLQINENMAEDDAS